MEHKLQMENIIFILSRENTKNNEIKKNFNLIFSKQSTKTKLKEKKMCNFEILLEDKVRSFQPVVVSLDHPLCIHPLSVLIG